MHNCRIIYRWWSIVLGIILLWSAQQVAAAPATPQLTLEVVPATLELPWQGDVEALVVVRNPSEVTVRDVRLSWFTNTGVQVTATPTGTQSLAPGSMAAWTLRLASHGAEPPTGPVHLRVDYTGENESGSVSAVALGTLAVTSPALETVDKVAQLRIETSLATLMQHRPGVVYLVLTNSADVPVQVQAVHAQGPEFVMLNSPDLHSAMPIAPGQTLTFSVGVDVPDMVQPGKHLLLFELPLAWERDGRIWQGTLVRTLAVEAGVLGESELLTLLGIPSLLVLPGFLMMMVWSVLWRQIKPKHDFPFAAKTAEFWLFAITLSLLAALTYPLITGWFGLVRNYLHGYSLNDIWWVWIGALGFAVLAYSTGVCVHWGIQRWKQRRLYERQPQKTDNPMDILRKLDKQGLSLNVNRAKVPIQETSHYVYLLEPLQEAREMTWVGPRICIHWRSEALRAEDRDLQEQVTAQLEAQDLPGLLAVLATGQQRNILELAWDSLGDHAGPFQIATAELAGHLETSRVCLVREE